MNTLPQSVCDQILGRMMDEARLVRAWNCFAQAGLSPLLIKGWSTVRLYPGDSGRRLGDIDLCFHPDEIEAAVELKARHPDALATVDLHQSVPDLPDRSWNELIERSVQVSLQNESIRILAPEEHLRLTCRHLVRHGLKAERMWNDVRVLLQTRSATFDWDECLRGDEVTSNWVRAICDLVQSQESNRFPERPEPKRCPKWFQRVVTMIRTTDREKRSLGFYFRHPRIGIKVLMFRTFNPVRAAFYNRVFPRNSLHLVAVVLYDIARREVSRFLVSDRRRRISAARKDGRTCSVHSPGHQTCFR